MEGVRRMTAHPLLPLCKSYNIFFTNFLEMSRFFFFLQILLGKVMALLQFGSGVTLESLLNRELLEHTPR